jgi:hypothetical protein
MRLAPPQGATHWPLYRKGWYFYRHTVTAYPKANDGWGVTVRGLTRRAVDRKLRKLK